MKLPALFDLTGRVAVVTGGNGGIGRGIALGLAEAGTAVASVWAKRREGCRKWARPAVRRSPLSGIISHGDKKIL